MGCGPSSIKQYRQHVKGDENWASMCERLDLIDKECAPFFKAFKKMDKSKDGEISCHEFFKFASSPLQLY